MRALVTGGAGFIGSWLSAILVAEGHEVVIIDNLTTGDILNIPSDTIFPRPLDICRDSNAIAPFVSWCDCLFHLAAAVGVDYVLENQTRTKAINVKGTKIMLALAHRYRKPILFASTSEVYGDLSGHLVEERATLESSASTIYGMSKWKAEQLTLKHHRNGNSPAVVVRLFNVVGPRQTWHHGMVLPTFAKQALNGEDITVFGDGDNCRSFTDIRDAANALVSLMFEPKATGQVVNIGADNRIRIGDLAIRVKELSQSTSRISYIPYQETRRAKYLNPKERIPDFRKANYLIGYNPIYKLSDSISALVVHMRQQIPQKKSLIW